MSLINLRYLPKHSFISLIIPHIQTYHEEFGLLNKDIIFNNNKFTLNSKSSYNYTISELNKTTSFYTHITTFVNKSEINIHENINIKNNYKENYLNYSVNIVDKKYPLIYSIKCIGQPMSIDLMKHYTDDIKMFYNLLKK